MRYNQWVRRHGDRTAKEFLEAYSTPQSLRETCRDHGVEWLIETIGHIPYGATRLGVLLNTGELGIQDARAIHNAVYDAARDYEVWTARDGTETVRYL